MGLTFSPDGEYIYSVTAESNKGDTMLSMIPVLGGAPRRLLVRPHGPVSFSPDASSIAFIDSRRDVYHLYVADKYGGAPRVLASRTAPEKFIDIAIDQPGHRTERKSPAALEGMMEVDNSIA